MYKYIYVYIYIIFISISISIYIYIDTNRRYQQFFSCAPNSLEILAEIPQTKR